VEVLVTSVEKWLYDNSLVSSGGSSWLVTKTSTSKKDVYELKGIGDILGTVGQKIMDLWGSWEAGGDGAMGWIYDNTVGRLDNLTTSIQEWLYDNAPLIMTRTGGSIYSYKYEMKGMGDIIGDIGTWVKDTIGGFSADGGGAMGWLHENTVGKLSSTLAEAKQEILGHLPSSLIKNIGPTNKPVWALKGFGDIMGDMGDAIGTALNGMKGIISDMIPSISIPSISLPSISDITGWIQDVGVGIRQKIADFLDSSIVSTVLGWASAIPFIGDAVDPLKNWVDKYKSGGFAYYGSGGGYGAQKGYTDYKKGVYQTSGEMKGLWSAYGPTGKGPFYGEMGALIKGYQRGGIVPGPIGAPQMAMVHGGEMIVPAGGTNNNQKTFNIQINSNLSAADIVKDIDLMDSLSTSAYSTVLG